MWNLSNQQFQTHAFLLPIALMNSVRATCESRKLRPGWMVKWDSICLSNASLFVVASLSVQKSLNVNRTLKKRIIQQFRMQQLIHDTFSSLWHNTIRVKRIKIHSIFDFRAVYVKKIHSFWTKNDMKFISGTIRSA